MRNYICFLLIFGLSQIDSRSQDTFSIVAVDSITGEVGSAGASCIDNTGCGGCGGVVIISDMVPGRGAVNAQATVCIPNNNLNNSMNWMGQGKSPAEILNLLLTLDACMFGDTSTRQYGIVDLDSVGRPRSQGFTGKGAMDYKNHIVGPNYSIQGNILLGQQILDSMEVGFLNTKGSLAHKLMAALQGANVPGADTRCLAEGVSSQSGFIRVARPEDTLGTFCIDLIVPETPFGAEPIDSVQTLFDEYMSNSPPIALYGYSPTLLTAYFTNSSVNSDRWSWDFGDGTGSTEQNPNHLYSASGQYTVCLTAYNGCVSNTIVATVNVSSVGIEGSTTEGDINSKVRVFPNPGNGRYTISLDKELLGSTMFIYDEMGKLIKEITNTNQRKYLLDLSEFAKGIYNMKVVVEGLEFSKTIIYQ